MSNLKSDSERHTLLEKLHAPQPILRAFSRSWITIVVMIVQVFLYILVWAFSIAMIVKKVIPLPDNLASWTFKNPSETNMLVTMISTILGMSGSFLLGIAVQHALTFRLPHGVRFLTMTAWIQLARNSVFFRPRRHLRWTLTSVMWVSVIHFLTTAWSNLITPEIVVQQFTTTGRELDFLNPAMADYIYDYANLPHIDPTTRNYSLTPGSTRYTLSDMTFFSQAGRTAALTASATDNILKFPVSIESFNSSTGGVLCPISDYSLLNYPLLNFAALDQNYKGLSSTYAIVQQGYTANVSCTMSSSPTITLNNTASLKRTYETPSGSRINQTMQSWSWSTNCSADANYYTGEAHTFSGRYISDQNFSGPDLLASSVCFYQDFSGPSNQSFLLLMHTPNNSNYDAYYAKGPNLRTVCQVTPMVTTMKVQYGEGRIINANDTLEQARLPDDSWPLVLLPGFLLWSAYFLSQGPYSNSMADDIVLVFNEVGGFMPRFTSTFLEQYLRGIIESLGSSMRSALSYNLTNLMQQPLPDNMTTPLSGTMNVQTMGWRFHPQTHGISLAVLTLVTVATVASGIFALMEANRQKPIHDPPRKDGVPVLDPTDLVDVLVSASTGSLASALWQCGIEEDRENLRVGLAVTDEGQYVLNACQ